MRRMDNFQIHRQNLAFFWFYFVGYDNIMLNIEKGNYLVTRCLHAQQFGDDWEILTDRPVAVMPLEKSSKCSSVITELALRAVPSLNRKDIELVVDNRSEQQFMLCDVHTGKPMIEVTKIEQGMC